MSYDEQTRIIKAIDDLRADMRQDNEQIWAAIKKLNDEVSTGRGAIKALVWVGGIILAVAAIFSSLFTPPKIH